MQTTIDPTHAEHLRLLSRFIELDKQLKGEPTLEQREALQAQWDEHCEQAREALGE